MTTLTTHLISTLGKPSKPRHRLEIPFFRPLAAALSASPKALALAIFAAFALPSSDAEVPIKISIDTAGVSSAGIYDQEHRLVRTLWSNTPREAGEQVFQWDGLGDDGAPVSGTGHYAKIISHNLTYTWEGKVGNTSKDKSGANIHRGFEPLWDLDFDDKGMGYYVVGYNEGQNAAMNFHMNDYQTVDKVAPADHKVAYRFLTTDSKAIYFANNGGADQTKNIQARTTERWGNGGMHPFFFNAAGTKKIIASGTVAMSGIVAEKTGNHLYVAYKSSNIVKVLNKLDGTLVRTIAIQSPSSLERGANNTIWLISGNSSNRKLTRISNGSSATPTIQTVGPALASPLAVAVSPDGNTILVADGGASQQIKAFNASGTSLWTYGQQGGYTTNGPAATPDKFFFEDHTNKGWFERTFITYSPDGRIWVGEPANFRTLIFDSQMNYLDQIMFVPHSYVSAVDPNDPKRVFCGFLEFEVDYSKPLAQSWKLVNNWSASYSSSPLLDKGGPGGINAVATLAKNGVTRTFAILQTTAAWNDSQNMFELPATGPMRQTAIKFSPEHSLYGDGSIRWYSKDENGAAQTVYRKQLVGFSSNGDPEWGANEVIARAPKGAKDPYYKGSFSSYSGTRFPITESGNVVFFDQERRVSTNPGYHLGAVEMGENKWKWKTSPTGRFKKITSSGSDNGYVTSPDGSYDDLTAHQYGGSRAMVAKDTIVYGYHGEFWNQGQANQWLHFTEDGLFLGQFGTPNYPWRNSEYADQGAAGNAFSPSLVEFEGKYYLYHNDESVHAGVHRWRIEGMDTIKSHTVGIPQIVDGIVVPVLLSEAATFIDYVAMLGLPSGQNGPLDDPDQDGMPNLLEFIYNTFADAADDNMNSLSFAGFEFAAVKIDVASKSGERACAESWKQSYDGSSWTPIAPQLVSETSVGGASVRRLKFEGIDEGRNAYIKRTLSIDGKQTDVDTIDFTIAGTMRPAAGSASSFEEFVSLFRLPSEQSAYGDDPDGDGMPNLVEYIFHTDPGLAEDQISALSLAGFEPKAVKIDVASDDAERAYSESWLYSYNGSTWTAIAPELLSESIMDGGKARRLKFSNLDELRQVTIKRVLSIGSAVADAESIEFAIPGSARPNPKTATTFSAFVSLFQLPTQAKGHGDDPDGDGLSNLAEFIYNTDPGIANPPVHSLSIAGHGSDSVAIAIDQPADARSFNESWTYSYDGKAWKSIAATGAGGPANAVSRELQFAPFTVDVPVRLRRKMTLGSLNYEEPAIQFTIASAPPLDASTATTFVEYLDLFQVPSAARGPGADPDGDRVANLVEYLHNLDPGLGTPLSSTVSVTEYAYKSVSLQHTEPLAKRDFIEVWEISKDYKTWQPASPTVLSAETIAGEFVHTIQFKGLTAGAHYVRRSVEAEGRRVVTSTTSLVVPAHAGPDPRDASTYEQFQELFDLPEQAKGFAGDPDDDGISNIYEFLFHSDPLVPNNQRSKATSVGVASGRYYLVQVDPIERRAFSEQWIVSRDLVNWTETEPSVLSSATNAANGLEVRELSFEMPAGATTCFFARRVTME